MMRLSGLLIITFMYSIAYKVFHSGQGAQGLLGEVSKQTLDTIFGSHKDDVVVKQILDKGVAQHADAINNNTGTPNLSVTRGSGILDNKGKGLSGH